MVTDAYEAARPCNTLLTTGLLLVSTATLTLLSAFN